MPLWWCWSVAYLPVCSQGQFRWINQGRCLFYSVAGFSFLYLLLLLYMLHRIFRNGTIVATVKKMIGIISGRPNNVMVERCEITATFDVIQYVLFLFQKCFDLVFASIPNMSLVLKKFIKIEAHFLFCFGWLKRNRLVNNEKGPSDSFKTKSQTPNTAQHFSYIPWILCVLADGIVWV